MSSTSGTFAGKVVLITGASSGIGAETARHFYREGARLSLTGRNAENLNKIANECGNALTILGDIALDTELAVTIVNETIKAYTKIDILVNNAGIIEMGSIENTSLDQFDKVFNVNVRAIYNLTMHTVPFLIKTKGCIVNVSSVCGLRAFPGILSYCMSKSALDQFTRCVALELASKSIRVNSVNPGVIVTPLQQRGGMNEAAYKEFLERAKTSHALGRPGQAEEVASVILFLASDKASFITGETLAVDGGRHAMCPR